MIKTTIKWYTQDEKVPDTMKNILFITPNGNLIIGGYYANNFFHYYEENYLRIKYWAEYTDMERLILSTI